MLVRTSAEVERVNAQQRWTQRPFTRYTIQVLDQQPFQTVHSSYQVWDEQGPPTDQHTVRNLFALLEQSRHTSSPCSANPAHYPLAVTCPWTATYHATLGYPIRMAQRCVEPPNWLNLYLWQTPGIIWDQCKDGMCERVVFEQTLHIEVTPLP